MNQRFYTVADLADLLAVKPVTIYRMVRRGRLIIFDKTGLSGEYPKPLRIDFNAPGST